jgi:transposase-like protein
VSKHGKKSSVRPVEAPRTVAIQIPLRMMDVLRNAESAFLGLCLEAGREVLGEWMERDREALCGPKGRHLEQREAYRAGSTQSEITFGGRRIPMRRPRARSVDGQELVLPSFAFAAGRDPLDARTQAAVAAGVATRRYASTLEGLPEAEPERSVSRSSVSRRFVALTQRKMGEWLSAPIGDRKVRIVMIDGKVFADHAVLIALGIAENGEKIVLGVREGTTENATVARDLLRELIERGVPADQPVLFVIDGGKGLRSAIRECFGAHAWIQRCREHKRRNVLGYLPKRMHAIVARTLRQAWSSANAALGHKQLERLAASLERDHPDAAGSLREGLQETFTLQRLGLVDSALARTLRTTNPIENLMGSVERFTRNVKRWRSGSMILRWVGAAVHDAQPGFRRIRGHRELAALLRMLTHAKAVDSKMVAA